MRHLAKGKETHVIANFDNDYGVLRCHASGSRTPTIICSEILEAYMSPPRSECVECGHSRQQTAGARSTEVGSGLLRWVLGKLTGTVLYHYQGPVPYRST